jgi:hypothetical protein
MTDAPCIDVALGYDPGGDGGHGVAAVHFDPASAATVEFETVKTVEHAVTWLAARLPRREGSRAAIGIDTLTVWSTGSAGWRPADAWLRQMYSSVRNSVAAPNSLFGSMAIGGVGVLVALRELAPSLIVSETHPKVLYFAIANEKYAFDADAGSTMNERLRGWTGWAGVTPRNDHQWDAVASAWAVHEGAVGRWERDLHALPTRGGERLLRPAGPSHFFWPPSSTEATSR